MVSPMLNKAKVYLLIFSMILLAYVAFILYKFYNSKHARQEEHFTVEEESAQAQAYQARMHVMKVFDFVLNRKPTSEEITRFSAFKNEQDILINVLKVYAVGKSAETTEEESMFNVVQEEMATIATIATPPPSVSPIPDVPVSQVGQVGPEHYAEPDYYDQAKVPDKVCISRNQLVGFLDDLSRKIEQVRRLI